MQISKFKRILEGYGINSKEFNKTQINLSKKFGKEASQEDTIWSLFGSISIRNIQDFHKTKMIYYCMALFLNEEGKNHYDSLFQSKRFELMHLKKEGIKKVRILSSTNGCTECQKMNDKVYAIEKAIKEMPLPHKKCKYYLRNKSYGFCRCIWLAVWIENNK